MRELRTIGRAFDAEVEVYENCKYTAYSIKDLGQTRKVKYNNITSWEIVSDIDAKEIEAETTSDGIDELHEYLVLHFEDGSESTFRNSHVDMFILK